jgi:rhomboid protease GluP
MDGVISNKDELVMKLLHYFITDQGYNPIILHGGENEIWLENLDAPYKIVRIMTGHIHNHEQLEFDLYKTKTIMGRIKRKTLSFKMNALSIFIDLNDSVDLESLNDIDCVHINEEKDLDKYDNINKFFPNILNKLKFNEDGIKLFTKITEDINEKNKKDAVQTEEIFKTKVPYITYILIGINILVLLAMYLFGDGPYDNVTLVNFGAMYAPLIHVGEYYRLITDGFVHIGFLHLFFNMYALYIIGSQIESFYGHFKYLGIYFFSILTGSLLSMIFNTNAISAGASGAIFGLLGAMLYFGYHYRVYLGNSIRSQIIPIIILNLGMGLFMPGIDVSAHLGGLLGGFLISTAIGVKYKSTKFERINGVIVSILALLFLIYIVFIYMK